MARERYSAHVECPECKQTGTLSVSENDYAFMKHFDRKVKCAEGEFDAVMIDDKDAKITCKKCSHEFKW